MIAYDCPRKRQGIELSQLAERLAAQHRRERNIEREQVRIDFEAAVKQAARDKAEKEALVDAF